ncbi:MAG: N-acetyltransferase family protein [Pseudomonadota bacterium]
MTIRPATAGDAKGIAQIANHYIRETTVTFNAIEKTVEDVTKGLRTQSAAGYPFLVAEDAGSVVGYATYGQFRKGSGYARTMENTVMLDPTAQHRGHGRKLMAALEAHAAARGVHSMIAGISAENTPAVMFHLALGYTEVGRVAQSGYKFDRWIDLILLQKHLS